MAREVILENKLNDEVTIGLADGAGTVIVRVEVDEKIAEQSFMLALDTAEAKKIELEG